jgi:hypothetical protein
MLCIRICADVVNVGYWCFALLLSNIFRRQAGLDMVAGMIRSESKKGFFSVRAFCVRGCGCLVMCYRGWQNEKFDSVIYPLKDGVTMFVEKQILRLEDMENDIFLMLQEIIFCILLDTLDILKTFFSVDSFTLSKNLIVHKCCQIDVAFCFHLQR